MKPDKTVQKLSFSTPSRLVGEYISDVLVLSIAFSFDDQTPLMVGAIENPYCKNYYVAAVKTEEAKGPIYPNYSYIGNIICTYLSILFGKRFDYNGLLETLGHFSLPVYNNNPVNLYSISFNNHKARKDLGIELNLEQFKLFSPLIESDQLSPEFINILQTAGMFYARSLRLFESEPEIAFLDLVTCGEVLSNCFEFSDEEVFDEDIKKIFGHIQKLEDSDTISNIIKSRLFQVKRRYVLTLLGLLNDYFFTNTESKEGFGILKKEDIEQCIKATYDLRSKYVHTGIRFGWAIKLIPYHNEVQIGKPVTGNDELDKILAKCPTIIGFERIIRFCLLRFIHLFGFKFDGRLDGPGLNGVSLRANFRAPN